jgi:starch synthase
MANPTRILFVSGEVAPFAKHSGIADLVRTLPEKLQETNAYEIRIMMPRYGNVSERRNRLHEVIRLSGTEVPMGESRETLKVKVASIPGIRLQVYFMDNNRYFKRKGIYGDKAGKTFEDNPARALFFARSALATIRNLGWAPDVVHGFGWMSSLVPFLLRTEYANDPLFNSAKVIFTPGDSEVDDQFSVDTAQAVGLTGAGEVVGRSLSSVALHYADAAIYQPNSQETGQERFSTDPVRIMEQVTALYDQALTGIAA